MYKAALATSVLCVLLWAPTVSPTLRAQDVYEDPGDDSGAFRPEELDQMLAPVALYPDSLLSKVLMAATYPSEIDEASRFVYDNSGLDGQTLADLATGEDWDPSVKALLEFPDILGMLDDRIDWTREMGDAFLGQQRDVMESVQRLRSHAYAAGNLKTTPEMVVRTESGKPLPGYSSNFIEPVMIDPVTIDPIVIDPISFDSYSVPVYDPDTVYGEWWWPAYPPLYYYPPAFSPGAGIGFWAGVAVGKNWDWSGWNWNRREVTINTGRYNGWAQTQYAAPQRYQRPAGASSQSWHHDTTHRREEPYRDRATAQRYGQGDLYRGSARAGQGGAGQRNPRGGDRGFDRGGDGASRNPGDRANHSAFDGAGAGGGDRAASVRGQASRGGGGGISRPAGGARGGGGGRRR